MSQPRDANVDSLLRILNSGQFSFSMLFSLRDMLVRCRLSGFPTGNAMTFKLIKETMLHQHAVNILMGYILPNTPPPTDVFIMAVITNLRAVAVNSVDTSVDNDAVVRLLSTQRAFYCASPPIKVCLHCHSDLKSEEPENHDAIFYDLEVPGLPGALMTKRCPCGVIYYLDGWEKASNIKGNPIKSLYPDDSFYHKTWVRSTRSTVLSLKLLKSVNDHISVTHSGFEPIAKIINRQAQRNSAGLPLHERSLIHRHRLEEAWLRWCIKALVLEYCPYLVATINLNFDLDALLLQVLDAVEPLLRDEGLRHCTESPVSYLCRILMIIDGNMKLTVRRCMAIVGDFSLEQKQLEDTSAFALSRYCQNDPDRKSGSKNLCTSCFESYLAKLRALPLVPGPATLEEVDEAEPWLVAPDEEEDADKGNEEVEGDEEMEDATVDEVVDVLEQRAPTPLVDIRRYNTRLQARQAQLKESPASVSSPITMNVAPELQVTPIEVVSDWLDTKNHTRLYRVRWSDGRYSNEVKDDVPSPLLSVFAAKGRFSRSLAEDDEASFQLHVEPPESTIHMNEKDTKDWEARQGKHGKRSCKQRGTGAGEKKYGQRTGGVAWAFCHCGLIIAYMVLPQAESTRMMILFLIRIFQDGPIARPGQEFLILSFDDMCHMLRYIELRVEENIKLNAPFKTTLAFLTDLLEICDHSAVSGETEDKIRAAIKVTSDKIVELHPILYRFLAEVQPVIDKFHYKYNHKGKYCAKFCNPYNNPTLIKASAENKLDMSRAEQSFRVINRFKPSLSNMNNIRFRFMLCMITKLDHEDRSVSTKKRT